MADEEEYVQVGHDIVKLQPTAELRYVDPQSRDPLTGGWYPPFLQQKWVARTTTPNGTREEWRWRNIPTINYSDQQSDGGSH